MTEPIMDYLVEYFAARHDPRTVQGRKRLVEAVVPYLAGITDPICRDAYTEALARRSGVAAGVIAEVLARDAVTARQDPRSTGMAAAEDYRAGVWLHRAVVAEFQAARSVEHRLCSRRARTRRETEEDELRRMAARAP